MAQKIEDNAGAGYTSGAIDLDAWYNYEEINDPLSEYSIKYKDLVQARIDSGEDIDISDCVPSLEEMFTDDLAYDFYKALAGSDKDDDVVKTAHYIESPGDTLGYQSDNTFLLECDSSALGEVSHQLEMNQVDGDTR